MLQLPQPRCGSTLILKADLLAAHALMQEIGRKLPERGCIIALRIDDAHALISHSPVELLVTGIDLPDGDVLDRMLGLAERHRIGKVLVVTRHREPRLIASLRSLAVNGIFDTGTEETQDLPNAIRDIESGKGFWSDSVALIEARSTFKALFRDLNPTEHLAFGVLGDGCGDKIAADRLGMTLATTRTLRRNLHRKLGAHDRADLTRLAVHFGFVRFTEAGIYTVGLDVLRMEYERRKKRSTDMPVESSKVGRRAA